MARLVYAGGGAVAVLALEVVVAILAAALGLLPVDADVAPSAWEARLLPLALRAAVARRAAADDRVRTGASAADDRVGAAAIAAGGSAEAPRIEEHVLTAATAEDLAAGAAVYDGACARCHGRIGGGASALGAAFHPPAPPLPGHRSRLTTAELRHVVTHGIRMTAMPAWGALLSARDIDRVVALIERFGDDGR